MEAREEVQCVAGGEGETKSETAKSGEGEL